jgi:hypothetical protein
MACVLDTDNKVGSHCGLSVVGKAFDVHPYAWTVLFQRLPPRRHKELAAVLLNGAVGTVIAME